MTAPLPGNTSQVPPYDPTPAVVDDRPPARPPGWLLTGPTLAASLGAFLLTVVVGPHGMAIQESMHLPTPGVLWLLVAYLLPAVPAVAVGTLVGRRWPITVALLALVLLVPGSLLTAFAPGSGLLLSGRAVTGFGAGLAWGVTAVLVARTGPRRVLATLLAAGAVVLALGLAPVVGMLVAQALGWRWPLMLAVPFGAVTLLITAVSGIVVLVQGLSEPARPQAGPGRTVTAPPGGPGPGAPGTASGRGRGAALLLVTVGGVHQVTTQVFGMDLVPEVARLLGAENVRSTRLGSDLTLWHIEDSPGRARAGQPNPAASLLAAEHGLPPVTGPAVFTGPMLHGSPYPLDSDQADRIATRLRG